VRHRPAAQGTENRSGVGRPSTGCEGRWRRGRTFVEVAEAEEMQEDSEKEARDPSLEAAARRTSGSASSPWSKKTARKRVRQERSRPRRISFRYAASSHPCASIARCACAVASSRFLLLGVWPATGNRRASETTATALRWAGLICSIPAQLILES
jgi:hypothetical protein